MKKEKKVLHCEDGPAIKRGKYKEYWLNGQRIQPRFFNFAVKSLRALRDSHEKL